MTDSPRLHPRAAELIRILNLQPHPEGGFYRELFRSSERVHRQSVVRSAATTIYFLLAAGSFSRWHRVTSDEIWHWYEGEPLELLLCPPDFSRVQTVELGAIDAQRTQVHTVPANWWQAARPMGGYALTGCTVAPGFEFADFSFLADDRTAVAQLHGLAERYRAFI
jgi:predicted cupin superfamily sugar epimerase